MQVTHDTNTNIWNKRLNWVNVLKNSKDKYEKLSLRLKIAYYDFEHARRYSNLESKRKARAKITALNRQLKRMTRNDELEAIRALERNLAKQIEYDKKLGYTFSEETRNGRKYLYKYNGSWQINI